MSVELNEKQLSETFDKYDPDKLGYFNRLQMRKFAKEVFTFKDGAELTDGLFEIIYGLIDEDNSGKLMKTQVMVFCMNV